MEQSPLKTGRIDVVDALRGFAVMAILLVHMVEHFIYNVYPVQSVLDEGTFTTVFSLFAGKSYAIFALLFGLTYSIQLRNQHSKGGDFGGRFVWRLVGLIGFATLNAAFFPGGDVLSLFCVTGLVLPLVRRWSNRWVLLLAVFFLLQPMEWAHYIASWVNPDYVMPNLGVGALYDEVIEAAKGGQWGDFLITNITTGQVATLAWALGAGRFTQTMGLFLLGFLIGRKQLFASTEDNHGFWTKVLIVSAVLFGPLYALKELAGGEEVSGLVKQTVGTMLDMWQKLAYTGVLVSAFVLMYRSDAFRKITSPLRTYGKMSLTNYLSQSIIGALIFFPIGLNLAPHTGYFLSFLLGFPILFAQIYFCQWWLKSHKQGPLESIWHKFTWLGAK